VRDEILERSEPLDAATLLDLGTGDGLIGLAALDRVGPCGNVIFCDISEALLDQCREAVDDRSLTGRAQFVNTQAENLAGIADNSVDVVITRAVLIFVTDKPAAFTAIHRVLRRGGRMTLREPVGSLMFPEADDRFWGYAVAPETALATKVKAAVADLEDPIYRDAMMNFDDRDLNRRAPKLAYAPPRNRTLPGAPRIRRRARLDPGRVAASTTRGGDLLLPDSGGSGSLLGESEPHHTPGTS
jgi:arsenite methyltransferase